MVVRAVAEGLAVEAYKLGVSSRVPSVMSAECHALDELLTDAVCKPAQHAGPKAAISYFSSLGKGPLLLISFSTLILNDIDGFVLIGYNVTVNSLVYLVPP